MTDSTRVHDGLLFVLAQPETVGLSEFHDWYDHEHAPARVAFDGIDHATRWHATDEGEPAWLATYDIDLEVLERPDYRALRDHRSARERAVIAGLSTFERRTYRLLSESRRPDSESETDVWPGPLTVVVGLDVEEGAEAELHAWYEEEHIPMLLVGEGWLRTRRYELVDDNGPGAPRWLALHDVAGPEALRTAEYRRATSTPRREAVMASVLRRERRVFAVHRRFM